MNPVNISTNALNWCYAACGIICLGGVATCWSICTVDGPLPVADAAGAKVSTITGTAGSAAAGMMCDDLLN